MELTPSSQKPFASTFEIIITSLFIWHYAKRIEELKANKYMIIDKVITGDKSVTFTEILIYLYEKQKAADKLKKHINVVAYAKGIATARLEKIKFIENVINDIGQYTQLYDSYVKRCMIKTLMEFIRMAVVKK